MVMDVIIVYGACRADTHCPPPLTRTCRTDALVRRLALISWPECRLGNVTARTLRFLLTGYTVRRIHV